MDKQNRLAIINTVGRYFLRVCKNYNMYSFLKKGILSVSHLGKNRFSLNEHTYMKAIVKIFCVAENEYKKRVDNSISTNSQYDLITIYINMLLHQFLEKSGVNPRNLGMIGQAIFDYSCNSLFGQDFVNYTNQMNKEMGLRKPQNEREMAIMSEYQIRRQHGENITLDSVFEKYSNYSDEDFWSVYGLNIRGNENYIEEEPEVDDADIEEEYYDDGDVF